LVFQAEKEEIEKMQHSDLVIRHSLWFHVLSPEHHRGPTADHGLPSDTDNRHLTLNTSGWALHENLKSKCDSQSYNVSIVPPDQSKLFQGRKASHENNAGFPCFTPKLLLLRENNSLVTDFCISPAT